MSKAKKASSVVQDNQTMSVSTSILPASEVRKSQPYCIYVKNTADSEMEVDILNAAANVGGHFTKKGELIQNDYVFIGCPFATTEAAVTYRDILYMTMYNPFKVGQYYLQAVRENGISPIRDASFIRVHTRDANGTFVMIPIEGLTDPYQFQNDVQLIDQEFIVDGMTGIKFKMPPNSKIFIYIYPCVNLNAARTLNGNDEKREFANPGIIRGSKIVMSPAPAAPKIKNPGKKRGPKKK